MSRGVSQQHRWGRSWRGDVEACVADAVWRHRLEGAPVVVAVSGGVDSSALAHAAARLSRRADRPIGKVTVAHVHHGLRGSEADADERAVRRLADKLDVPVEVAHLDLAEASREGSSRTRPTLQELARRHRYQELFRIAQARSATLLTAHHADDQAETVLLRLMRGSGPDGLAGIPEWSAERRILRPLLGVSRREIEAYARSVGIDWREDSSNDDRSYTRNRLRHEWLPGLADAFNPQLLRAVADLAEAQRQDAEWWAEHVERAYRARVRSRAAGRELAIELRGFSELPVPIARRFVRRLLREAGLPRDVSRAHIDRVGAFLEEGRAGAVLELPRGRRLSRRGESASLRMEVPGRDEC